MRDDFRTKPCRLLIITKQYLYRSKIGIQWQIICQLLEHVTDIALLSFAKVKYFLMTGAKMKIEIEFLCKDERGT